MDGVLFSKDGVSFGGSHIDRSRSYSKLSFALELNAKHALALSTLPKEESFIRELGEAIEDSDGGLFNT